MSQVNRTERVLLITDSYYPSRTSAAKMMSDLAQALLKSGRAVSVAVPSAETEERAEIAVEDGVEVVRIRTGRTKGQNKLVRGYRELDFSRTIWWNARSYFHNTRFDLIAWYSPCIFFGPLVTRLKKLYDCPAYLVQRDLWTQWMLDIGELREGSLPYKLLKHMEKTSYFAADVIGVQSLGDLDRVLRDTDGNGPRVEVLDNWYLADDKPPAKTNFREGLGFADKALFFYGGNCGSAQNVLTLVDAAAALRDRQDIAILVVGWGSQVEEMQARIAEHRLENIRLLSAVAQEEYPGLVAESDVGVVCLDRRLCIQNVPGKLMSYLALAKPVLASINANNELNATLPQSGAGLVCENGDIDAFCGHVLRLAGDGELRQRMGAAGRRLFAERFAPEAAVRRITAIMPRTEDVSNAK